jgi:DNA-binding response OmpR family regulator
MDADRRRTVLVVEDDRAIAELILVYLEKAGYRAACAPSAEEAQPLLSPIPDLVLLDLGLPGRDGLDFLRELRASSTVPVIIVSARESDEDKLAGLGLGADDFVTKPFSPRFLAARVDALFRRISYAGASLPPPGGGLAFGPFVLDFGGRTLARAGRPVYLSRKEFELLAYLAARPGICFEARELHRQVWGFEHGDISTVAVHIGRLRRKMGEDLAAPRWIGTVPGSGYRFVPEEKA